MEVSIENQTILQINSKKTIYERTSKHQSLYFSTKSIGETTIRMELLDYPNVNAHFTINVLEPIKMSFNQSFVAIKDVVTFWNFHLSIKEPIIHSFIYEKESNTLLSNVETNDQIISHHILCNQSGTINLIIDFGYIHKEKYIAIDRLLMNIKCVNLKDLYVVSKITQITEIKNNPEECQTVYKDHVGINDRIRIDFILLYKYANFNFTIPNIVHLSGQLIIDHYSNTPLNVDSLNGYELTIDKSISFSIKHIISKTNQEITSSLKITVIYQPPSVILTLELLLNDEFLFLDEKLYPSILTIKSLNDLIDIKRRDQKIYLWPKITGQTSLVLSDLCFNWNQNLMLNISVDIKELLSIDVKYDKSHILIDETVTIVLIPISLNNLPISSRFFRTFSIDSFIESSTSSIEITKSFDSQNSLKYTVKGSKIGEAIANFKINFISNDKKFFIKTKNLFFEVFEDALFDKPKYFMIVNVFFKINHVNGPKHNFKVIYEIIDNDLCNISTNGLIYGFKVGICSSKLLFITDLSKYSDFIHPTTSSIQNLILPIGFENYHAFEISPKNNVIIKTKQTSLNIYALTENALIPLDGLYVDYLDIKWSTNSTSIKLYASESCSIRETLPLSKCPINQLNIYSDESGFFNINLQIYDKKLDRTFNCFYNFRIIEELICSEFTNNLLLLTQMSYYQLKVQSSDEVKYSVIYSNYDNFIDFNVKNGEILVNSSKYGYSIIEVSDGYQKTAIKVQVVQINQIMLIRSQCHDTRYCSLKSIFLGGLVNLILNPLDFLGRFIYGVPFQRFSILYTSDLIDVSFDKNQIILRSLKTGVASISVIDKLDESVRTSFSFVIKSIEEFSRTIRIGQFVCPYLDSIPFTDGAIFENDNHHFVPVQGLDQQCFLAVDNGIGSIIVKDRMYNDFMKLSYSIIDYKALEYKTNGGYISNFVGFQRFFDLIGNQDDNHKYDVRFAIESHKLLKCSLTCSGVGASSIAKSFYVQTKFNGENLGCELIYKLNESTKEITMNLPEKCYLNASLLLKYHLSPIELMFIPSIQLQSHSLIDDQLNSPPDELLFKGYDSVLYDYSSTNSCSDEMANQAEFVKIESTQTANHDDYQSLLKINFIYYKLRVNDCSVRITFNAINQTFLFTIPPQSTLRKNKEKDIIWNAFLQLMTFYEKSSSLSTKQIFPIIIVLTTLFTTIILCRMVLHNLKLDSNAMLNENGNQNQQSLSTTTSQQVLNSNFQLFANNLSLNRQSPFSKDKSFNQNGSILDSSLRLDNTTSSLLANSPSSNASFINTSFNKSSNNPNLSQRSNKISSSVNNDNSLNSKYHFYSKIK